MKRKELTKTMFDDLDSKITFGLYGLYKQMSSLQTLKRFDENVRCKTVSCMNLGQFSEM